MDGVAGSDLQAVPPSRRGRFSLVPTGLVAGIDFAVVSGIAYVQHDPVSGLFGAAAGFLAVIASALIVRRAVLVSLIEDLAFG